MIIKRWNVHKNDQKYTVDIADFSFEQGHSVTVSDRGFPVLRAANVTRQEAEGHAHSFITSLESEGYIITPEETP